MEEEMHPGSGVGEEKISEVKVDDNVQEILINGDEKPKVQDHDSSNSSKNLSEAQDNIRELKLQLKTVNEELQNSDTGNSKLKAELDFTSEKLKLLSMQYEELQVEHKRIMDKMSAEEHKYNLQDVSLQNTLKDLEGKHKELSGTKEAFDDLSAELESSRKKLEELELHLEETANQARKFEELGNQSNLHAELQSERASELEKMLETAKLASIEMEDHVNKLQEELKGLHRRLEESTQVEEILRVTKLELAEVMEKLESSKSHVEELEHKLSSKEASIDKLTQELDLYQISEDQMKQDKLVCESILSSVKEDLQAKIVALEEVNLKLDQETKTRETAEERFQNQEIQMLGLQEVLVNIKGDKEILQSKLDGLSTSEKELTAQLTEAETQLTSAEKRNDDLELQISLVEQNFANAEKVKEELSEKNKELTALLSEIEQEHALSRCHAQGVEDRVNQLESSLNISYSKNSKLELELKDLAEKCAALEEQVNVSHQRSLELHDSLHEAGSKGENAEKKIRELELLLEAVNHEKQQMEEHLKYTEGKYNDAEVEVEKQASRVLELSMELQELKANSDGFEVALQSANDKEKELIEMINVITEERNKLESLSNSSAEKLLQTEKLIEDIQTDLKYTQEKLGNVERNLEVSGLREKELEEKLKSAEEQLENERKTAEQSGTRFLELESLHNLLVHDSERKLEAAAASLSEKDSEVKQLYNKLNSVEEQASFYQEQVGETTEKLASLMIDMEASAARLIAHERTIEELTAKITEGEGKAELSFAENEKIKKELEEGQSKIKELYESLNSIHTEKEVMDSQVLSYLQNITELTNDRSRSSEYQSQIEASVKETEAKLSEALERAAQRDSEASDLKERLFALEAQCKVHEEHANELTTFAENCKAELEEAVLKMQSLEQSLEETRSRATDFEDKHVHLDKINLSLSEKLEEYEKKVHEFEGALKAITEEKEDASVQLQTSRKAVEDLTQDLISEREKLQLQISSVSDENNRTIKMYQDAKDEIEALKSDLQQAQHVHKTTESSLIADLENLKAELAEKSQLQVVITELKQQLSAADIKYQEEIENLRLATAEKDELLTTKVQEHSTIAQTRDILMQQLDDLQKEYNLSQSLIDEQKESVLRMQQEREYVVVSSHGELEAEQQRSVVLEKQVEELKQKLETAQMQNKKVDGGIAEAELKDEEVKSRDFELPANKLPSKRKNKKRSGQLLEEREKASTSSAGVLETSGLNSFKFFLGVVAVSLVVGVFLGKRY